MRSISFTTFVSLWFLLCVLGCGSEQPVGPESTSVEMASTDSGSAAPGIVGITTNDVVTIGRALYGSVDTHLVVTATSSASPEAQLFLTVPGCVTDAPLTYRARRDMYVFSERGCLDLAGQTATVTSSLGGSDTAIIQGR